MSYRCAAPAPASLAVRVDGSTLRLGEVSITFQRTLRIPDDGRSHPLPPGLGAFPIRRVDDFASRVPAEWRERGGVMIPMYQREAMWLSFGGSRPSALKVGVGKVCAISGERWSPGLSGSPQRYVVTGTQPWLDGIATGKGTIRQFVAMPLGMGYTVEGQVTGEERFGGIQLEAFAPKPGRIAPPVLDGMCSPCSPAPCKSLGAPAGAPRARAGTAMGLAAGGRMKQKVYPDPYGMDVWDTSIGARCYVHIVSSEAWREITGEEPPATPVTAQTYAQHGYPWFELYDEHQPALEGSSTLASVMSVAEKDAAIFGAPLSDEQSVSAWPVRMLRRLGLVRDGSW
jgi:hypothetical protein